MPKSSADKETIAIRVPTHLARVTKQWAEQEGSAIADVNGTCWLLGMAEYAKLRRAIADGSDVELTKETD